MKLEELYEAAGGDYELTLNRLHSEDILKKFVKKYAEDPSYSNLIDAVAENDWEAAFRAVHTMKGIAQNLGFGKLQTAAEALTEDLRGPAELSSQELLDAVKSAHTEIVSAIGQLDD